MKVFTSISYFFKLITQLIDCLFAAIRTFFLRESLRCADFSLRSALPRELGAALLSLSDVTIKLINPIKAYNIIYIKIRLDCWNFFVIKIQGYIVAV